MKKNQALTIIEFLVVVGIIALVGASTTPFLSSFILRNNLETTTNELIGTIRKAQVYAMDGKSNVVWGICQYSNNIRLFGGDCNTPTIKEDFTIPDTINITGLSTIVFSGRGEPSDVFTIIISTSLDSHIVQLNQVGGMDIN